MLRTSPNPPMMVNQVLVRDSALAWTDLWLESPTGALRPFQSLQDPFQTFQPKPGVLPTHTHTHLYPPSIQWTMPAASGLQQHRTPTLRCLTFPPGSAPGPAVATGLLFSGCQSNSPQRDNLKRLAGNFPSFRGYINEDEPLEVHPHR